MKNTFPLMAFAIICFILPFLSKAQSDTTNLFDLSLEQLMKLEVVTVSNVQESFQKAPAHIIVITEEDIAERGYMELYDVFNDLPGFDLSRAFGDDQYYVYTRGYRKTISDQLLLMVDGVVMNFLYNNNMNAFGQFPMSNIKQIEVVYGPASAVYGPNALSGVINIITKKNEHGTVNVSKGVANTHVIDMNAVQKVGEVSVNFTGRMNKSDGYDLVDRQPFIRSELYTDTMLWGPFRNTDFFGYKSPIYQYYIDGSINAKGLTVGLLHYYSETGYGTEYPGDKVLNAGRWTFNEQTMYAKFDRTFKTVAMKSLLKYRNTGTPGNALWIERYSDGVDASFWGTTNRSYSFFHDVSTPLPANLFLNFGLKWEHRDLQKNYVEHYGPFLAQDTQIVYPFTKIEPIVDKNISQFNHYQTEDVGTYAQLKYVYKELLDVVGGLRYDHNSIYGGVINPRAGVVVQPTEKIIAKVFFGTAFLEPTARSLYGGWQGSGSSTTLKPERITSFESSIRYTGTSFSAGVSGYYNIGTDVISGITNIGTRRMTGADIYGKVVLRNTPSSWLSRLKADVYLSYLDSKEDLQDSGKFIVTGNMAPIKVHAIVTGYVKRDFSLGVQTRWISKMETVATNPLKTIDSYFVTDIFANYRNLFMDGLSLGLKVYNLTNTDYSHPGYRAGDAGEEAFDANGNRLESLGWYSSRLPQPKRSAHVTLRFDF